MLKLYAIVKKNKNGEGKHVELRVNLGYADRVISFDKNVTAEILGLPLKDLAMAEEGKQWEIK